MRKFYSLLIAVLLTTNVFAQVPQKMSYQAVIRNSSDQLVTNHSVGMRVSILQGSSSGTAVYVETQTPTSNTNGLVTIEIGGGTPVTGTFTGINWSTGTYFIKTETDPIGGTSYNITGTSQLLSAPYAMYAKTSETSADAVKLTGDQSIAGTKTFTGTINAGNKVITNIATPINNTDASNKAYVDVLKQQLQDLENKVNNHLGNDPFIGVASELCTSFSTTTTKNVTVQRLGTSNSISLFLPIADAMVSAGWGTVYTGTHPIIINYDPVTFVVTSTKQAWCDSFIDPVEMGPMFLQVSTGTIDLVNKKITIKWKVSGNAYWGSDYILNNAIYTMK